MAGESDSPAFSRFFMRYLYIILLTILCSCNEGNGRETSVPNSVKLSLFYDGKKYDGNLYSSADRADLVSVEIRDQHFLNIDDFTDADSIVGIVYFYSEQITKIDTLNSSYILATAVYSKEGDELFFELFANSPNAELHNDIIKPLQTSIISTNDLYALNDLYLGGKCKSLVTFINYRKLNKSKNVDGELQRHISDKIRNH